MYWEDDMNLAHVAVATAPLQLVCFELGQEEYGVGIQFVKEIIRKPEITKLPNAPQFILGVINLRGQILPIISLHQRFHLPQPDDDETKIVVVECGGLLVGMEVDEVSEVLTLDGERISAAPPLATTINSSFIQGVGKLDDRLLIILDVERILTEDEHAMLRASMG
jgi:purine-binding chemotaxis protein CheW